MTGKKVSSYRLADWYGWTGSLLISDDFEGKKQKGVGPFYFLNYDINY